MDINTFFKNGEIYVNAYPDIDIFLTMMIEVNDKNEGMKITNETGQLFETDQLYFDQKTEWFYTEKRYKFTDPKGVSFGEGVDFSKDFKIINSQRISGEVENND